MIKAEEQRIEEEIKQKKIQFEAVFFYFLYNFNVSLSEKKNIKF